MPKTTTLSFYNSPTDIDTSLPACKTGDIVRVSRREGGATAYMKFLGVVVHREAGGGINDEYVFAKGGELAKQKLYYYSEKVASSRLPANVKRLFSEKSGIKDTELNDLYYFSSMKMIRGVVKNPLRLHARYLDELGLESQTVQRIDNYIAKWNKRLARFNAGDIIKETIDGEEWLGKIIHKGIPISVIDKDVYANYRCSPGGLLVHAGRLSRNNSSLKGWLSRSDLESFGVHYTDDDHSVETIVKACHKGYTVRTSGKTEGDNDYHRLIHADYRNIRNISVVPKSQYHLLPTYCIEVFGIEDEARTHIARAVSCASRGHRARLRTL